MAEEQRTELIIGLLGVKSPVGIVRDSLRRPDTLLLLVAVAVRLAGHVWGIAHGVRGGGGLRPSVRGKVQGVLTLIAQAVAIRSALFVILLPHEA